ncbi:hypothetical protein LOK49_LG01G00141 [Camellia lanceoleosa]|uniref:Uncharacterized protein n=1 Tax=Camellia lanceoleosa TaxID=1840588 RepID=A0ACC0IZF6_9ERIC|nr:hypothetical protein LOK49_LG01G00141 [Camellia lanceoleosa]
MFDNLSGKLDAIIPPAIPRPSPSSTVIPPPPPLLDSRNGGNGGLLDSENGRNGGFTNGGGNLVILPTIPRHSPSSAVIPLPPPLSDFGNGGNGGLLNSDNDRKCGFTNVSGDLDE